MRRTAKPSYKNLSLSKAGRMRKYSALRPRIAKMFDVYAIKSAVVMERTAGTESRAKMMSVLSTVRRARNNGVANSFPLFLTKKWLP